MKSYLMSPCLSFDLVRNYVVWQLCSMSSYIDGVSNFLFYQRFVSCQQSVADFDILPCTTLQKFRINFKTRSLCRFRFASSFKP